VAIVIADQWLEPTDGVRASDWEEGRLLRARIVIRQNRIQNAINRYPAPTLVYVYPSVGEGPSGWIYVQIEAMRAAQDLGIPCVNGYSGYRPAGWEYFSDAHELVVWLQAQNTPPERLAGLVVVEKIGE
jgi:hypothetical protein